MALVQIYFKNVNTITIFYQFPCIFLVIIFQFLRIHADPDPDPQPCVHSTVFAWDAHMSFRPNVKQANFYLIFEPPLGY